MKDMKFKLILYSIMAIFPLILIYLLVGSLSWKVFSIIIGFYFLFFISEIYGEKRNKRKVLEDYREKLNRAMDELLLRANEKLERMKIVEPGKFEELRNSLREDLKQIENVRREFIWVEDKEQKERG